MTDGKQKEDQFLCGLDLRCHRCGCSLPLLHPHIVVERYDESGNMICEGCHEEGCRPK